MTTAYWCVLAATILPLVWVGIAKAGGKDFDNTAPRNYLEKQGGRRQRANWAQKNAFEALPGFAAGTIIARLAGTAQGTIDTVALIFIAARILHGIAYIQDLAGFRTLVWTIGFGATIAMFVIAA